METFDTGKLFISITGLSNLAHVAPEGNPLAIPIENYQNIKDMVNYVYTELGRLDFPLSLASARELKNIIHNEVKEKTGENLLAEKSIVFPLLSTARYKHYSTELVNRFKDEGSAKKVIVIPSAKEKFYDLVNPIWGMKVQNTFPDMIEDITEANNCYALDRNTACVFHLMRVMEKAVQKLAIQLGLTTTSISDKEWQKVINDIRGQLNLSYPKHGNPDRIKYESILGHLETIKIAWRNPTMHPKVTYGEQESKAVLNSVEVFIKDLAKIC